MRPCWFFCFFLGKSIFNLFGAFSSFLLYSRFSLLPLYLSVSLSLNWNDIYVEVEITGKLWNENQKSQVRIFVDIYTSSTIINQHRTHTEKSEPSTTMLTTCFGNEAMRFRCLFNLQLKWETANKFEMRKNRFFRYKFLFSPITFSFFFFSYFSMFKLFGVFLCEISICCQSAKCCVSDYSWVLIFASLLLNECN